MKPTGHSCPTLAATLLSLAALTALTPGTVHSAVTIDFNLNDGGFTVSDESGHPGNPWDYSASGGQGGTGGWLNNGNRLSSVKLLTSPTFVATGGAVMFGFDHRFSFEFVEFGETDAYDGGQLQLSVNGGAFNLVPDSSLTGTPYTPDRDGVDGLGVTPGFSGISAGYAEGDFVSTTADLGTFSNGDTVTVRFRGGWDNSIANGSPNWVIDNVSVTGAVPEPSGLAFLGLASLGLLRRRR